MILKTAIRGIAALGAMLFLALQAYAGEQKLLSTPTDKMNYTTGVDIVRKLKQQGGEINLDLVIKGMKDELTGDLLLSENELRKIMASLQSGTQQKQAQTETRSGDVKDTIDSKTAKSAEGLPAAETGTGQKQDVAPEKQDEQTNQGGFLAQGVAPIPMMSQNPASSGIMTQSANGQQSNQIGQPAASGTAGVAQTTPQIQDGLDKPVELGGRLLPDGTVISKRNQAILRARELKAGMRAE